jgi:hypothetical protein
MDRHTSSRAAASTEAGAVLALRAEQELQAAESGRLLLNGPDIKLCKRLYYDDNALLAIRAPYGKFFAACSLCQDTVW